MNDGNGIGSDKINNRITNLSSSTKKMSSKVDFFNSKASLAFTQLRKAFIKALILHYFNLKLYMQIKTNIAGYIIDKILS